MENIEIRNATENDIESILKIENLCFVCPWKKENLLNEILNNPVSIFLVITISNVIVGFVDFWITYDSSTITQIAIDEKFRRCKLGSRLLKEIFDECYAKKVRNITLEVRESNIGAISFYEKHGFKKILIKPKYYSNGENAFYMMKEVKI